MSRMPIETPMKSPIPNAIHAIVFSFGELPGGEETRKPPGSWKRIFAASRTCHAPGGDRYSNGERHAVALLCVGRVSPR